MRRRKEEHDEPMIFLTTPLTDNHETDEIDEDFYSEENAFEEEDLRKIDENTGFVRVDRSDDKALVGEVIDWAKHILLAVIVGLLLVVFVVQRNEVVGKSMEPSLNNHDQLLVQKISRLLPNGISRGDIVTVNAEGLYADSEDKNIIKRVVGIPGDSIVIKDGFLWRNGERVEEDYLADETPTYPKNTKYQEYYLGEYEFYVLGDNRESSLDSRSFGPVTKDKIIGEVLFRFYPFGSIGVP